MITWGKRLNKKKMPTLDMMYTIQGRGEEDQNILLAHAGKTLEDRVKELKIDNAIIRKEANCLRIWISPRKRIKNKHSYYHHQNAGDWDKNVWIVRGGKLEYFSKLCYMCKDKMKGIVDECKEPNSYNPNNMERSCIYDLTIPDTSIDLSSMREVSNGMLNSHSAFRNDCALSEINFSWPTINKNKEAYAARANCSKNKPEKMKKHCSRCIFECSSKLINSNNVGTKCCLTYDQALKSGFFKNMKVKVTTSIYENGVFVDDCKLGGWGDKITLHNNKYVRYQQPKEETQK